MRRAKAWIFGGWQPVEQQYQLTRQCCRLLLDAGFGLNILTKSRLILRDLDIFAGRDVRVGVTMTTADESWASIWEPGASTVSERVDVLRPAKAAGLKTAVMFGPLREAQSRSYPKTKQSRDREGAVWRFATRKPLAYARGSDRNAVLG